MVQRKIGQSFCVILGGSRGCGTLVLAGVRERSAAGEKREGREEILRLSKSQAREERRGGSAKRGSRAARGAEGERRCEGAGSGCWRILRGFFKCGAHAVNLFDKIDL